MIRILGAVLALLLLVPAVADAQMYTVRPGDSLYLISHQFGTSVASVENANRNWNPSLYPGERLWIPAVNGVQQYVVHSGDTLYLLARRFGTTITALKRANRMHSDELMVGQLLRIPTTTASSAGSATSTRGSNALNLLSRIVASEARDEPYAGEVGVAAVVLNRVQSPLFPNTIAGVIFEPHQFTPVSNGLFWNRTPNATEISAARDALNGWDPTHGALYFWVPAKVGSSNWIWSRPITYRVGNQVFAR